jgi:hypothetical protein
MFSLTSISIDCQFFIKRRMYITVIMIIWAVFEIPLSAVALMMPADKFFYSQSWMMNDNM